MEKNTDPRLPETDICMMTADPEYATLQTVLTEAYHQASQGKGKERHALGEPFEEQLIAWLERRGHTFNTGQAIKKIDESLRLPAQRAINELYGAIVYISSRILALKEEQEYCATLYQPDHHSV